MKTPPVRFVAPALAIPGAASAAMAVELSGAIRSATGTLRHRFVLRLKAPGREAAPRMIFDPKTAGALDFLIYPAKVPEPELAAELIGMDRQDQVIRNEIKPDSLDKALPESMGKEDFEGEQRLGAIIEAKGRPTIPMVGPEAAYLAWLIAQHASPSFLKRCLPLLKAAAENGEMALGPLVLSIDHGLAHEGEPQIYGNMEPLANYPKRFDQ